MKVSTVRRLMAKAVPQPKKERACGAAAEPPAEDQLDGHASATAAMHAMPPANAQNHCRLLALLMIAPLSIP